MFPWDRVGSWHPRRRGPRSSLQWPLLACLINKTEHPHHKARVAAASTPWRKHRLRSLDGCQQRHEWSCSQMEVTESTRTVATPKATRVIHTLPGWARSGSSHCESQRTCTTTWPDRTAFTSSACRFRGSLPVAFAPGIISAPASSPSRALLIS